MTPETIPTDEATEAADTEPATAPAADARSVADTATLPAKLLSQAAPRTDWLPVHFHSSPKKAGSKGSTEGKSAPKPEAKCSQGFNRKTDPVQEWIADGAAELEQQGVDPKFAVSLVPLS